MDKETAYRLEKISKKYGEMAKNVVKNVESEHYRMTMDIVNNSKLSNELRRKAMHDIERGYVKRTETVVDSGLQREMDKRMESDIAKEVRAGNIKLSNNPDAFMRQMKEKMQ